MIDQNFGTKELLSVTLRARDVMWFGDRRIEVDEPVLYFENINISMLSERSSVIAARGGWANMPRVIWEDRDMVQFSLSDGVMSSTGMSLLLNANVISEKQIEEPLLVNKREYYTPVKDSQTGRFRIKLEKQPTEQKGKKIFIFSYDRDVIQKKLYGKWIFVTDPFDREVKEPWIELYEDKEKQIPIDKSTKCLVDYYYEYGGEALIYKIHKERFNGLFSFEGKFYSKDENDGKNYTNIIRMPKVRVVSDISLRLGERADPTVSVFNIIGLPENAGVGKKNLILDITRLDSDIDDEGDI